MSTLDKRLTMLEKIVPPAEYTFACADDFLAWERSLTPTERAAVMATVNSELAEWHKRRGWHGTQ